MAQVPIVSTWQEASAYLQMLKGTVTADIRPLLDVPGHAPFAICREALSYVDHLEPVASTTAGRFWLPVSTKCLVEDLMCSIKVFEKAGPENERVTAWN